MIESAEEFKRLRESDIPEEYHKAAHAEADIGVWEAVLQHHKTMAFWVAQNKTVPVEILEKLAKHEDSRVRSMVASKRKIPESLMLTFVSDSSSSVRHSLVNNGKVTERVLSVLAKDSWQAVRDRAIEKLHALTT